jgi:hypothetical protein
MTELEIALPPQESSAVLVRAIEAALLEAGLEISLRGTLKKFPGCQHWHARPPGKTGTLEITLWPQAHRAWITIQDGRTAEWIAAKLPAVRTALRSRLFSD